MLDGKIDKPAGILESLAPCLLIPGIVELMAVPCDPARVAEHGRGYRADARLCQCVDPTWERRRYVDHGRNAAHQELRQRDTHGRHRSFAIVVKYGQKLVERAVPEAGAARL